MSNPVSLEDLYAAPSSGQPLPPDTESAPEASQTSAGEAAPPKTEGTGEAAASAASGAPPAPSEDLPSDIKGLQAALKAERSKRQEYGTKASEYEKQLAAAVEDAKTQKALLDRFMASQPPAQPQQQPKQQRQAPPDPLMDPEAAFAYQSQLFANALQERDGAIIETRVLMSQEMMRTAKPDYDEMETAFAEAAEHDPSLWQKLYAHPFPARFAYEEGKRLKVMHEMGADPQGYMQSRIDAAVAAALAKMQGEQPAPAMPSVPQTPQVPTVPTMPRASLPQSLATVPSTAPRSRPVFSGPVPLDQLYK